MARLLCVLVVLLAVCVPRVGANGKYFPPNMVLDHPTIPSQTAFIRYDEGVQTLIVESSVKLGEGDRFAWVLPLPNEPTLMEPVGSTTLVTLRSAIDRDVVTRSPFIKELTIALVYAGIIALFFLVRIFLKWRTGRSLPILLPACLLVFLTLLWVIGAPYRQTRSGAGSAPPSSSVEVLQREAVGSYDISVLKAKEAQQLDTWLSENEYATLGEDSEEVVQDYVDEGWIFLAIKLRRAAEEELEPHPLKVVFPSPHPVFPMRLTAEPGQKTNVAIFTAGPVPYTHPRFRTIFRREVGKWTRSRWPSLWDYDSSELPITPVIPIDGSRRIGFANPDILSLIENGEWLTRLEATLSERTMREDIILSPLPKDSERVHVQVYTTDVVLFHAISAGLLATFLFLPIGCSRLVNGKRSRGAILWGMVGLVLVASGFTALLHERAGGYRVIPRDSWSIDEDWRRLPERVNFAVLDLPTDPEQRRLRVANILRNEEGLSGYGQYSEGRDLLQFHFVVNEDGRDALRFVLKDGSIAEQLLDDIFAPAEAEAETLRRHMGISE